MPRSLLWLLNRVRPTLGLELHGRPSACRRLLGAVTFFSNSKQNFATVHNGFPGRLASAHQVAASVPREGQYPLALGQHNKSSAALLHRRLSDLIDKSTSTDAHSSTSTSRTKPLSGVTHVLDDVQHAIRASSIPIYAWPILTKLRSAGMQQQNIQPVF